MYSPCLDRETKGVDYLIWLGAYYNILPDWLSNPLHKWTIIKNLQYDVDYELRNR